jgi:hypothetical protein
MQSASTQGSRALAVKTRATSASRCVVSWRTSPPARGAAFAGAELGVGVPGTSLPGGHGVRRKVRACAACAGQAVGSGDGWTSRAECAPTKPSQLRGASAGAFFGVLATGAVAGAAAHGAGPLERAVSR